MASAITDRPAESASTSLSSEQSVLSADESDAHCSPLDTGQGCLELASKTETGTETLRKSCQLPVGSNRANSYAGNKNMAEGLMDIALLSANANQLRFLITYNHDAPTFYISVTLVAVSLLMQITVGIALIFKRRFRSCRGKRYNELILGGVFLITVVNILLAAFTTTTAEPPKP